MADGEEPNFHYVYDFITAYEHPRIASTSNLSPTKVRFDMFKHIHLLLLANQNKLWYNPFTSQLISNNEKERLIASEKQISANIKNTFSDDSSVRIFGDIAEYDTFLRPKTFEASRELMAIANSILLQMKVYTAESRVPLLAKLFADLPSDFIWVLCLINDDFQIRLCSDPKLWETLWKETYPDTLIPAVRNLQRLWLELRERSKAKHIIERLNVEPMTQLEVKGKIIRLANQFQLIDGDLVTVSTPSGDVTTTYVLSQYERGFDIIKLGEDMKLPEEMDRIRGIKGDEYWDF